MEYIHNVGLMAIILSVLLILGPNIRSIFRGYTRQVSSFGGGVAIAYVFLILFPEVEHSREWVGASVYVITVLSLLVFYGLEILVSTHNLRGEKVHHGHHNTVRFWFHIAIIWVYTWLMVFTVPDDAADNLIYVLAGSLTIGVHLLYKDYVLHGHYDSRFEGTGRYVLALAPLAGWASHQVIAPSEGLLEIMIAILAGILILSVFQEELPPVEKVSYGWLLTGVLAIGSLSIFA